MIANIRTVAFAGMETKNVDVQVHIGEGLPAFNIVGLADKAVNEAKERVRASISSLGMSLPPSRITVNLSPANLPKEGTHYDLPIALGILAAINIVQEEQINDYVVMGELKLDGSVAAVPGILPAAIQAKSINKSIIVPKELGVEATWAGDMEILAANNLLEIINHLKGSQILLQPKRPKIKPSNKSSIDMSDVKGQESAKRALKIAAAGGHNLLMIGPPGSGKSMLASRINTILPDLENMEILEVSSIYSIAGMLKNGKIFNKRPYRDPHFTSSPAALVGGGIKAKPGEISLAHNGVLFLDELPEFPRNTLESLRQPIENKKIVIARANAHIEYPAKFQLIAAMNPCRCSHVDGVNSFCKKGPQCAEAYQSKISGPLMDRFDMIIDVPAVKIEDLYNLNTSDDSSQILDVVKKSRQIQKKRFSAYKLKKTITNSDLTSSTIDQTIKLNEGCKKTLINASKELKISARGFHRILKVAQTIADLDMAENQKTEALTNTIEKKHLLEAIFYRKKRS